MIGIKMLACCFLLTIFCATGPASAVISANYGFHRSIASKMTSLIINGHPVANRPFFARVRHLRDNKRCGGVIIDRMWALTAAECVHMSLHFDRLATDFQ